MSIGIDDISVGIDGISVGIDDISVSTDDIRVGIDDISVRERVQDNRVKMSAHDHTREEARWKAKEEAKSKTYIPKVDRLNHQGEIRQSRRNREPEVGAQL